MLGISFDFHIPSMTLLKMVLKIVIIELLFVVILDAIEIPDNKENKTDIKTVLDENLINIDDNKLADIFDGVYSECFLHLSYSCLQKKSLIYLKELNNLSEVSVIGDYVKFVKLNITDADLQSIDEVMKESNSEKLSFMVDQAVDKFFDNHVIKFSALGKNITIPNSVEGFVGRKKRKGGGGGGGGHGGFGHDDGGKKKMMMMAMMCMKMKLMMMVPAMMGMMGMMSFKGMMFSMMSFMISKMMLLMKILEKKGFGGGGVGGGDGSWAAGGGGGGAWMPAGGQDYGGGGGYDANGQWQSRSIISKKDIEITKLNNEPIISYVKPVVRYNNVIQAKDVEHDKVKSRKKRGIIDALQNVYFYWVNQILGAGNRRKSNNQRYKIVNGIKYVYYPNKISQKIKPHPSNMNPVKNTDEFKPIIIAEDFNKGETVEGGIESRMHTKKFHKIKDTVNDTFDENPWQ